MKQAHSTNIGGMVFDVEEDAYHRLTTYLEAVGVHFQAYPDAKDILTDIEGRIAEQLSQKSGSSRRVTLADVEQVVAAMGSVDQFDAEVVDQHPPLAAVPDKGSRRLFRDPDQRVIAGVAAGIAAYFDVSPLWVRLLFLASLFLGGVGLPLYIVLWLCIPRAKTATDKLRMRGELVTLAAIDHAIREQLAPGPLRAWGATGAPARVLIVGAACLAVLGIGVWAARDEWGRSWRNFYQYTEYRGPRHTHFDTLVTVSGVPTVDISTIDGEIRVTTWRRAQIRVVANVRAVNFDFGVSGSTVRLRETAAEVTCGKIGFGVSPCEEHSTYDVLVPEGTSLLAESGSGSQHIIGTHGAVHTASESGAIEIVHAGDVTAKTDSGDITLVLPSTVHATVEASSMSGTVTNEFTTATVRDDGGGPSRHISVLVNGGGTHVSASSVSGDIAIRRR